MHPIKVTVFLLCTTVLAEKEDDAGKGDTIPNLVVESEKRDYQYSSSSSSYNRENQYNAGNVVETGTRVANVPVSQSPAKVIVHKFIKIQGGGENILGQKEGNGGEILGLDGGNHVSRTEVIKRIERKENGNSGISTGKESAKLSLDGAHNAGNFVETGTREAKTPDSQIGSKVVAYRFNKILGGGQHIPSQKEGNGGGNIALEGGKHISRTEVTKRIEVKKERIGGISSENESAKLPVGGHQSAGIFLATETGEAQPVIQIGSKVIGHRFSKIQSGGQRILNQKEGNSGRNEAVEGGEHISRTIVTKRTEIKEEEKSGLSQGNNNSKLPLGGPHIAGNIVKTGTGESNIPDSQTGLRVLGYRFTKIQGGGQKILGQKEEKGDGNIALEGGNYVSSIEVSKRTERNEESNGGISSEKEKVKLPLGGQQSAGIIVETETGEPQPVSQIGSKVIGHRFSKIQSRGQRILNEKEGKSGGNEAVEGGEEIARTIVTKRTEIKKEEKSGLSQGNENSKLPLGGPHIAGNIVETGTREANVPDSQTGSKVFGYRFTQIQGGGPNILGQKEEKVGENVSLEGGDYVSRIEVSKRTERNEERSGGISSENENDKLPLGGQQSAVIIVETETGEDQPVSQIGSKVSGHRFSKIQSGGQRILNQKEGNSGRNEAVEGDEHLSRTIVTKRTEIKEEGKNGLSQGNENSKLPLGGPHIAGNIVETEIGDAKIPDSKTGSKVFGYRFTKIQGGGQKILGQKEEKGGENVALEGGDYVSRIEISKRTEINEEGNGGISSGNENAKLPLSGPQRGGIIVQTGTGEFQIPASQIGSKVIGHRFTKKQGGGQMILGQKEGNNDVNVAVEGGEYVLRTVVTKRTELKGEEKSGLSQETGNSKLPIGGPHIAGNIVETGTEVANIPGGQMGSRLVDYKYTKIHGGGQQILGQKEDNGGGNIALEGGDRVSRTEVTKRNEKIKDNVISSGNKHFKLPIGGPGGEERTIKFRKGQRVMVENEGNMKKKGDYQFGGGRNIRTRTIIAGSDAQNDHGTGGRFDSDNVDNIGRFKGGRVIFRNIFGSGNSQGGESHSQIDPAGDFGANKMDQHSDSALKLSNFLRRHNAFEGSGVGDYRVNTDGSTFSLKDGEYLSNMRIKTSDFVNGGGRRKGTNSFSGSGGNMEHIKKYANEGYMNDAMAKTSGNGGSSSRIGSIGTIRSSGHKFGQRGIFGGVVFEEITRTGASFEGLKGGRANDGKDPKMDSGSKILLDGAVGSAIQKGTGIGGNSHGARGEEFTSGIILSGGKSIGVLGGRYKETIGNIEGGRRDEEVGGEKIKLDMNKQGLDLQSFGRSMAFADRKLSGDLDVNRFISGNKRYKVYVGRNSETGFRGAGGRGDELGGLKAVTPGQGVVLYGTEDLKGNGRKSDISSMAFGGKNIDGKVRESSSKSSSMETYQIVNGGQSTKTDLSQMSSNGGIGSTNFMSKIAFSNPHTIKESFSSVVRSAQESNNKAE